MGLSAVLDDRQPEAGAPLVSAACLVDPVESLKQAGEMFRLNAASPVLDLELDAVAELHCIDLHSGIGLAVLDGVGQQVHHGLLEQRRVDSRLHVM